jgi:replicative DNA helicase
MPCPGLFPRRLIASRDTPKSCQGTPGVLVNLRCISTDDDATMAIREYGGIDEHVRILRADNGSEVTIGELTRTGERHLVWAIDERGRIVARPMTDVVPRRRYEVFNLRLASGREVVATVGTLFLKLDGRTTLSSLKVGDGIAVPRR